MNFLQSPTNRAAAGGGGGFHNDNQNKKFSRNRNGCGG